MIYVEGNSSDVNNVCRLVEFEAVLVWLSELVSNRAEEFSWRRWIDGTGANLIADVVKTDGASLVDGGDDLGVSSDMNS